MGKGKGVTKKNLFIVSDAGVDTGFARVAHSIINELHKTYNIDVLAINYVGDPHDIQSKARLWNPSGVAAGDVYGMSRLPVLVENTKADIMLFIQDPWILAEYAPLLDTIDIPKIAYTPVDAQHIKKMYTEPINDVYTHVIAYTEFGKKELIDGGLTLPTSVIPHGIDKNIFYPIAREEARRKGGIDANYFIVQVVDRNQQRKRIDLAIEYFADWVKDKPKNVMFYYHGAVRDQGWDIGELMQYHGIHDRLILSHQNLNPSHGFDVEYMKYVYAIADVKMSVSIGEG